MVAAFLQLSQGCLHEHLFVINQEGAIGSVRVCVNAVGAHVYFLGPLDIEQIDYPGAPHVFLRHYDVVLPEGPLTAPCEELDIRPGDGEKSFHTKDDGFFRVKVFANVQQAYAWLGDSTEGHLDEDEDDSESFDGGLCNDDLGLCPHGVPDDGSCGVGGCSGGPEGYQESYY